MTTKTEPAPSSPAAACPERPDRIRLAAVLVAIGGVVLLAVLALALMSEDDPTTSPSSAEASGDHWGGTLMTPAEPRPDFTLTDTTGRPYDFGAETGGQLTLLFFGYTNSPDI